MKEKKNNWLSTLFSFASPCKGKMILSVLFAVISVVGGFLPFWCVYQILVKFIEQSLVFSDVLLWAGIGVLGYLVKILFFGFSTVLSHISAYTILEGLRLKIFDRLMNAPLGEVMNRRLRT